MWAVPSAAVMPLDVCGVKIPWRVTWGLCWTSGLIVKSFHTDTDSLPASCPDWRTPLHSTITRLLQLQPDHQLRNSRPDCHFVNGRGACVWNIAISASVCLFVCLSICICVLSHILKTTVQISPNFLPMLPVVVARTVSDGKCDMLCTSGFVDDVMFHIMHGIGQYQRRRVGFVPFARWRHRGRSLSYSTASRFVSKQYNK